MENEKLFRPRRTNYRERAKQRIIDLFQKKGTLYYSDICRRLKLDLELVVDICNELEDEEITGEVKEIENEI